MKPRNPIAAHNAQRDRDEANRIHRSERIITSIICAVLILIPFALAYLLNLSP